MQIRAEARKSRLFFLHNYGCASTGSWATCNALIRSDVTVLAALKKETLDGYVSLQFNVFSTVKSHNSVNSKIACVNSFLFVLVNCTWKCQ